eukprot:SAG31_NODE_12656_length_926_cov_1.879081_1_plen_56_part_01
MPNSAPKFKFVEILNLENLENSHMTTCQAGSFQSSCANAIGGFQSEGNTAHVYTWR